MTDVDGHDFDRQIAYADLTLAAAIHSSRRTIRSGHWCWPGTSVAHQPLTSLVVAEVLLSHSTTPSSSDLASPVGSQPVRYA